MPDNNYEMAVELSKEYYHKVRMWSLAAAGAAFLVFAYFTYDGARFYFGSTVVEATVTELRAELSKSRRTSSINYRAHVAFLDSGGASRMGKIGTTNGYAFRTEVGEKILVRYNPEMLEYVRVDQFLPFWMRSIFSVALIVIALGFSMLFARIKPNKTIIKHYMKKM